ncbi:MAG: hypothetical protein Q3M30_07205 [Candidatus Electrothrix sp. Rat3]|nr:hypothetical protein [Candidatus Electrothrix rattekaaiensis]
MNNNEEGSSEKKSFSIRLIGPAIIALIPVVAYLLGISFYQGYLSTFGVNSDIFPISTQYVYLNAYYAVTHILFKFLSNILSAFELLKQIDFPFVFIILLNILSLAAGFWWLKKKNTTRIEKSITIVCIVLLLYPFLLLLLLGTAIFWWSPSRIASLAGQKIAEEKIVKFTKNGCTPDQKTELVQIDNCSVIQDKDGNVLHEGLLIAINDKDIAMFKKDGIYTFPRQNDWLIRRKLH